MKCECIAVPKSLIDNLPKLKSLVLLETIYYDSVMEIYYIDFENPLSSLLLIRFPELEINPQTITITIN